MAIFRDEKELQPFLKEKLEEMKTGHQEQKRFKEVHYNVSLSRYKPYDYQKKWYEKFLVVLSQPEIDLLVVEYPYNRLFGIELKYFRFKKKGAINLSFYEGIEEALAVLRFGLFSVSLWHVFDEEIHFNDACKYARNTENLTRILNLPINYHALRLTKDNEAIQAGVFSPQYTNQRPTELPSPYGHSNPLKSTLEAKRMDEFIRRAFNIPNEK